MSSNDSREERIERQAEDTGHPNESVYIAHHRPRTYHVDPDCQYTSEDWDETTRKAAKLRWLSPCRRCVL